MFCSPLGCAAYRVHAKQIAFAPRHLAFVPCSSKVALVSSHLSVSLGFRICPNCACTQPFLVPCSFPVFCHSRRGVFRCKHCNKGSQVPGLSHDFHRWRFIFLFLICMAYLGDLLSNCEFLFSTDSFLFREAFLYFGLP